MTTETRTCRRFRSVGGFEYRADFSQASSPIYVRFIAHEDFDWEPVPFQVADAQHNRTKAERMIANYFR